MNDRGDGRTDGNGKGEKEHAKLEAEARDERLRYERKEDKAISAKTSFLGRLGNTITSHYGLGNLFGEDEGTSARRRTRASTRAGQRNRGLRRHVHI